MIIGIDASKAARKNRTGVENFVYQLILHLKELDRTNIYFLYTDVKLPKELTNRYNFIEHFIPSKYLWNKVRLPMALLRDKPEKFIEPSYMIPPGAPSKTLAVIHDLAWIKFPKAYSSSQLILAKIAFNNITKYAKKIVCVSNSTKKDLIGTKPEVRNKVEIVELAGGDFRPLSDPKDILKIKSPYFLTVGRLEERKNISSVISAFYNFKESDSDTKLVLVGNPGFGYGKIVETIESNPKYKKDIILAGFYQGDNLNNLYSGAIALVFPSFYEGFGIPALDAMNAGTAVITSNVSSLPEVVGDAAILVDPAKVEEIAEAMIKVASDKNYRQLLIASGHNRAQKFSWSKTAQKILNILENL